MQQAIRQNRRRRTPFAGDCDDLRHHVRGVDRHRHHATAAAAPTLDAALAYVTDAISHLVYQRWTLTDLKRGCSSLADARRDHPAVFSLLLEHDAAVEFWERGRVQIAPESTAPSLNTILTRVLRQHPRFREGLPEVSDPPASTAVVVGSDDGAATNSAPGTTPRRSGCSCTSAPATHRTPGVPIRPN